MISEEDKFCVEKPDQKKTEEHESKRVIISFAILLGLTVLIGGLLDYLFSGVPLGFNLPIINVPATLTAILYYVTVLAASIYIGVMGLRERIPFPAAAGKSSPIACEKKSLRAKRPPSSTSTSCARRTRSD